MLALGHLIRQPRKPSRRVHVAVIQVQVVQQGVCMAEQHRLQPILLLLPFSTLATVARSSGTWTAGRMLWRCSPDLQ